MCRMSSSRVGTSENTNLRTSVGLEHWASISTDWDQVNQHLNSLGVYRPRGSLLFYTCRPGRIYSSVRPGRTPISTQPTLRQSGQAACTQRIDMGLQQTTQSQKSNRVPLASPKII